MPRKLTTAEFILAAREIHGDRYDYSETEYFGGYNKVQIICKEHGTFEQSAHNHIYQKSGCPACWAKRNGKNFLGTTEEFLIKARRIHGDLYDYSKCVYVGCGRKVVIICRKPGHGPFSQSRGHHLSGQGCPKCGRQKIYDAHRKAFLDYEDLAKQVQAKGILSQSEYAKRYREISLAPSQPQTLYRLYGWKGWGSFLGSRRRSIVAADGHVKRSPEEVRIQDFMFDSGIKYLSEIRYGDYIADWFLPDFGVFVECFGRTNDKKYNRKLKDKIEFCTQEGFRLISVLPEDLVTAGRLAELFKDLVSTHLKAAA